MSETPGAKKVTSAGAWNSARKEGFVIELPSGNVARLRKTLTLITLIRSGQIPNPLAKHVNKMVQERGAALDLKDLEPDAMMQMLDLVNNEIPKIFIEPRVYEVPDGEDASTWQPEDENGISITDLAYEDRFFAYSFAQGGPSDLATFRESTPSLADLPDGAGVPDEAVSPAGA